MIASVESGPSGESVIQTGRVVIIVPKFRSRENLRVGAFFPAGSKHSPFSHD